MNNASNIDSPIKYTHWQKFCCNHPNPFAILFNFLLLSPKKFNIIIYPMTTNSSSYNDTKQPSFLHTFYHANKWHRKCCACVVWVAQHKHIYIINYDEKECPNAYAKAFKRNRMISKIWFIDSASEPSISQNAHR